MKAIKASEHALRDTVGPAIHRVLDLKNSLSLEPASLVLIDDRIYGLRNLVLDSWRASHVSSRFGLAQSSVLHLSNQI